MTAEQDKIVGEVQKGFDTLDTKIKTLHDAQQDILKQKDRWDSELKRTADDMAKLQSVANDQQANFNAMLHKMDQFQNQLRNAALGSKGDPVARISGDEELRTRFNLAIRIGADSSDHNLRRLAPRLKDVGVTPDDIKARAVGEDTSPGSTLITAALGREIYDLLTNYGSWPTLYNEPLSTKTTNFPVDTADPVCNVILTEGGAIADDTAMTGTSVNCEAEVLAVALYVSKQLLEDAEYDYAPRILRKFARSYNKRVDYLAFVADGTADATNGGMTGIFNGGTLAAAASPGATVAATEIEDWMSCLTALGEEAMSRQSRWWLHPYTLVRMLSIKDSNGRPIFLTANESPTPGGIGSILGYPVTTVNIAPSANVANTRIATWGDPEGAVVGIRRDFQFGMSEHVRFLNLQNTFLGWGRIGFKVRNAGSFANLRLTT